MYLKFIYLCLTIACISGAPPSDEIPPERQQPTVIPIVSLSAEYEADGKFKYSYETGNGIKREETAYDKESPEGKAHHDSDSSNEGGEDDDSGEIHVQKGSYSYTAPDGTIVSVRYIADENGFQPINEHIQFRNNSSSQKSFQSASQETDIENKDNLRVESHEQISETNSENITDQKKSLMFSKQRQHQKSSEEPSPKFGDKLLKNSSKNAQIKNSNVRPITLKPIEEKEKPVTEQEKSTGEKSRKLEGIHADLLNNKKTKNNETILPKEENKNFKTGEKTFEQNEKLKKNETSQEEDILAKKVQEKHAGKLTQGPHDAAENPNKEIKNTGDKKSVNKEDKNTDEKQISTKNAEKPVTKNEKPSEVPTSATEKPNMKNENPAKEKQQTAKTVEISSKKNVNSNKPEIEHHKKEEDKKEGNATDIKAQFDNKASNEKEKPKDVGKTPPEKQNESVEGIEKKSKNIDVRPQNTTRNENAKPRKTDNDTQKPEPKSENPEIETEKPIGEKPALQPIEKEKLGEIKGENESVKMPLIENSERAKGNDKPVKGGIQPIATHEKSDNHDQKSLPKVTKEEKYLDNPEKNPIKKDNNSTDEKQSDNVVQPSLKSEEKKSIEEKIVPSKDEVTPKIKKEPVDLIKNTTHSIGSQLKTNESSKKNESKPQSAILKDTIKPIKEASKHEKNAIHAASQAVEAAGVAENAASEAEKAAKETEKFAAAAKQPGNPSRKQAILAAKEHAKLAEDAAKEAIHAAKTAEIAAEDAKKAAKAAEKIVNTVQSTPNIEDTKNIASEAENAKKKADGSVKNAVKAANDAKEQVKLDAKNQDKNETISEKPSLQTQKDNENPTTSVNSKQA